MGHRLKYYCEASAYDNKENTWDIISEQSEAYSLPEFELILEGFNRQIQGEALERYRSAIFTHIQRLLDEDEREIVESLIECTLPTYEAPREVINSLSTLHFQQPWARQLINKTISNLEVQQSVQDQVLSYLSLSL